MNYYRHHIGDYDSACAHLSLVEDALYRRLISLYYRDEVPISADLDKVSRVVRATTPPQRKALQKVIEEFFYLVPGEGWRHKRCDEEIAAYQRQAEKARANGKAGGRPRKDTGDPDGAVTGVGNPPITQPVTEARTDSVSAGFLRAHATNNHEPVTNLHSDPRGSGSAGAPPDSADLIFSLGVPLLTAAGVSDRNARSMLGAQRKQHGDAAVIDALQRCAAQKPLQPVSWLQAALPAKPPAARPSKTEQLAECAAEAGRAFLAGGTK